MDRMDRPGELTTNKEERSEWTVGETVASAVATVGTVARTVIVQAVSTRVYRWLTAPLVVGALACYIAGPIPVLVATAVLSTG
jgi:hypothetical protein